MIRQQHSHDEEGKLSRVARAVPKAEVKEDPRGNQGAVSAAEGQRTVPSLLMRRSAGCVGAEGALPAEPLSVTSRHTHLCVLGDVAHDGEEILRGDAQLPDDSLMELLEPLLPARDGDDKHALRQRVRCGEVWEAAGAVRGGVGSSKDLEDMGGGMNRSTPG